MTLMMLIQTRLPQYYPPASLTGINMWKNIIIDHLIDHQQRLQAVIIFIAYVNHQWQNEGGGSYTCTACIFYSAPDRICELKGPDLD